MAIFQLHYFLAEQLVDNANIFDNDKIKFIVVCLY